MSVAPESGRNRIMIYGPKNDGTYIVEFTTAAGEALAISVPAGETRVLGSRLIKPTMPGRQRDTQKRDNCVPVCHSGLRHV